MDKHESYYHGERPELSPFLPNQCKRVLEIGCGDGSFRNQLPGCLEYWGIEPSQKAAQLAEKKLNRVLCGTFETMSQQLPDRYFDLVICNDVMEHIAEPEKFIEMIKQKLVPDGRIAGSIPNVRYYKNLFNLVVGKDWKYTHKGILDNTHLRFFTKKSLNRFFMQNGFACEQLKGINSAIYLKKKYCTSPEKTCGLVMKFLWRFISFAVLDIITLGHSADTKYAQFAFRFRLNSSDMAT